MRRAVIVLAVAACGGSNRRPPEREGPERGEVELDRCLGDQQEPIDPSPIRATWEALVRGEHPVPLHLAGFSAGECKKTWWSPVEPLAGCGITEPRERWLSMLNAGTVVVDVATGALSLRPAGEEQFEVDGHFVTRRDGHVRIATARGAIDVPGFPERVIDDDHAIIATEHGMVVWDLVAGREVLAVRPRGMPAARAAGIAATEVVRDPSAPLGARVLAGVAFDAESEAFALDARGKLLASVRTAVVAYPVATPEGAMILAGYRDGSLEIKTIGGRGKIATRTITFDAGSTEHLLRMDVAAAGEVVVIGFATRAVVVRGAAEPVVVDAGAGLRMTPTLLAGGNVAVIASADEGTFVVDTRTGAQLARVTDHEPRFTVGAADVVLLDPQAKDAQYAVVVAADGTVRRGPLGETRVGRYPLRTFAGVVDPSRACDARALSALPPLVQYGDVYLPADLVVD